MKYRAKNVIALRDMLTTTATSKMQQVQKREKSKKVVNDDIIINEEEEKYLVDGSFVRDTERKGSSRGTIEKPS